MLALVKKLEGLLDAVPLTPNQVRALEEEEDRKLARTIPKPRKRLSPKMKRIKRFLEGPG